MTDRPEPESPPPARPTDTALLLGRATAYIGTLPDQERRIASLAAAGAPTWEIAQRVGISEAAVSRTLDGVIAALTGREVTPVETGGLGADTDPGVTGGYDPAGFGDRDPDPAGGPLLDTAEPEE